MEAFEKYPIILRSSADKFLTKRFEHRKTNARASLPAQFGDYEAMEQVTDIF